jgi:hypothetical protein
MDHPLCACCLPRHHHHCCNLVHLLQSQPTLSQQQCSHEVEVQQLKAQVGELQLEAQRNIELQTELHQDYSRMSSEVRVEQLEAEISELKEKISRKEKARVNNSINNNDIRAVEEGCTRVNKHKSAKPKPNSLKIKGKFKLVIGSSDDGIRLDTGTIQQEIRSDRHNRILTSQLGTDCDNPYVT